MAGEKNRILASRKSRRSREVKKFRSVPEGKREVSVSVGKEKNCGEALP